MAEKLNGSMHERIDRLAEVSARLITAYNEAHSPDSFEEEMALRRKLFTDISEAEL